MNDKIRYKIKCDDYDYNTLGKYTISLVSFYSYSYLIIIVRKEYKDLKI